jgi:hypothetical protein
MSDQADASNPAPAAVLGPVMHPVPTEEEAVAIAAALGLVLSSGAGDDDPPASADPRWRFSGRWWSRPVPLARQRPWRD